MAYWKTNNLKPILEKTRIIFKFGTGTHKGTGTFMAQIPLPNGPFFKHETAVVPIDAPFLVWIDVFMTERLQLDLKHNQLRDYENIWTLILLLANGNIYIYHKHKPDNCCFTRTEFTKMRKHFVYTCLWKIFNLLKRIFRKG